MFVIDVRIGEVLNGFGHWLGQMLFPISRSAFSEKLDRLEKERVDRLEIVGFVRVAFHALERDKFNQRIELCGVDFDADECGYLFDFLEWVLGTFLTESKQFFST